MRAGRIDPSTEVRFDLLTRDRWVEARDLEFFRRLYSPARVRFARGFSLGRFPIFTAVLCGVQVALYLGTGGFDRSVSLEALVRNGAKWQPLILELGQTWRLFAANVLHRDVLHLFFNVFFLFNVGGTVENAYRFRDYLFIIVVSAVLTTGVSTYFSEQPSVGASGIVLGLFGSATVFGFRYGALLPGPYRRYFGGAVLPCAIFILAVGLVTKDTDNWGHVGGLLGGIVAAVPLRPALLRAKRRRDRSVVWQTALIGGVVLFGGWGIRASGPVYASFEDLDSGIRLGHPARWRPREDHLGLPAFGNALGASIGVRAERQARPVSLPGWAADFRATLLGARVAEGEVAEVREGSVRPFLIDGGQGLELSIELESRAGPLVTRNLLIARGHYRYAVVVAAPMAWAEAYQPILEEMLRRVALVEPARLRGARARVRTFPAMSSARVELGEELGAVGRPREAARAYQRVLNVFPDQVGALYGLCRLALDYAGDLESAEQVASTLVERRPDDPLYALLLADLRRRLGQTERACAVVQETLDRLRQPPPELSGRLTELGCGSIVGFGP